jgi:hypothetical protein
MSTGNKFIDWCRIPPPAPKNQHKKLLASTLICTILSVSILVSLAPFYGSLMAGQSGALAASGTVLSVANLAEGPYFIQNVTYDPVTDANNSTVKNYEQVLNSFENTSTLLFSGAIYSSTNDSGNINLNITNVGERDLTVKTIEVYWNSGLFALINGPFTIRAHSIGNIDFQVYNLTELSKIETQQSNQINSIQEENNQTTINWQPIQYSLVLKTSDGVVLTYDHLIFPTVTGTS